MVDITTVFDAIIQFPVYLTNGLIYVFVSFADFLMGIVDLIYAPISTVLNIILLALNFIPDVMTSYFGWLFELSPVFQVLLFVSLYTIYLIIIFRLIKLLWDLLPIA